MKPKLHLLPCLLLASCASYCPAQEAPQVVDRISLSYAFDPMDRSQCAIPVLAYRLSTYHDLLGRPNFNADLLALMGTDGSNTRLGFALAHTFDFKINASREFSPTVGITIGAWTSYGTQSAMVKVGPYLGVTARF